MGRITTDEFRRLSVNELGDRIKAEGPGALGDVDQGIRFGFLLGAVGSHLLGLSDDEGLRRDFLAILDDEERAVFEAREAVAKADRDEVAAAAAAKAVR